jgi:xanthine dehydrogenase accessory factor
VREVLEAFLEELSLGRRAALATIVRATGSTPRTVGARMLVRADRSTWGTIGGGAFEAMVAADACELLAGERPAPVVKRYAFTEEGKDALGMACGGSAEVLIEVAGAGPRLIIFGAGHVGLATARLAATVGFVFQNPDEQLFERGASFTVEPAGRHGGECRERLYGQFPLGQSWVAGRPSRHHSLGQPGSPRARRCR